MTKDEALALALNALHTKGEHHPRVYEAIAAIQTVLKQLVQEPVACRFCHSKKGCWTWQCYHCGEIDDVQQPAPLPVQPKRQPLTVEEIGKAWSIANGEHNASAAVKRRITRAIEATHNIKENT